MTDWRLNYFSIMTIATKKDRVVGKHILLFLLLDLRIFLLFLCKCKFASAHFLHFGAVIGSFLHQYVAFFVGASLY